MPGYAEITREHRLRDKLRFANRPDLLRLDLRCRDKAGLAELARYTLVDSFACTCDALLDQASAEICIDQSAIGLLDGRDQRRIETRLRLPVRICDLRADRACR